MDQNNEVPKKKSSLLTIVLIIVVLAALAVFYFLVYKKSGNSVVSKVVPVSSTCKYNDPDLCKFINGWKDVKYYTVNSTSTFEGKEIKFVMKSIGDDKSQIVSSADNTENMNIITIGNDTYTKDYTDNKWVKSTRTLQTDNDANLVKDDLKFDDKAESVKDKTEYKKVGIEACGKLTCFKYQVIDPAITDSTEYIFFDNKQYQLRKTISVGPDNNQSTSEFDYSKISIDIPSPIKESESAAAPGAEAPAQMSQEQIQAAVDQMNANSSAEELSEE